MNNQTGTNALARAMQNQMALNTGKQKRSLDFGEIQTDLSILLNHFQHPIPQSDYSVCRSVMLGAVGDVLYQTQEISAENSGAHSHSDGAHGGHEGGDGSHSHEPEQGEQHVHDVLIGEKMRWLVPGDRVLVAWVGSDEVCVIDLIFPASTIQRTTSNQYELP